MIYLQQSTINGSVHKKQNISMQRILQPRQFITSTNPCSSLKLETALLIFCYVSQSKLQCEAKLVAGLTHQGIGREQVSAPLKIPHNTPD